MSKKDKLDNLVTMSITSIEQSEEYILITARSLLGKYRQYMITVSSEGKLSSTEVPVNEKTK